MHWVAAILIAAPGSGSPPADPPIIITGERAKRTSKETGSSHEVYQAGELDHSGAGSVEEFLSRIPNIQEGSLGMAPAIRGQDGTGAVRDLPAFTAGLTPRTTLQIDGREAGYFEMIFGVAPLWDVRQVEVFRGPQMVTQGRNAIAGAIFVTTKDPSFEREIRGRALLGTSGLRSLAAVTSGPINEQVAFRFSGEWRKSRPFTDIGNNMRGASPDQINHLVGRAKILIEPRTAPWLELRLGYQHVESQSPQSQVASPPFEDRKNPSAAYGIFGISVDAFTARANMDLGNSIDGEITVTAGRTRSRRFAPPNFGEARVMNRDRSLEARLERKYDRGRWATGLYLINGSTDQKIDLSRIVGIGEFRQRRTSLGIFAEVERRSGDVTASGAIRMQYDRQQRVGGFAPDHPDLALDFDIETTSLLPKISIAWDVTPQWRIGALLQQASAPGGGYLPLTLESTGLFDKERLTDFEFFIRGSFDDGRGSFSLNAFKYWMKDQQRSFPRAVRIPGVPVFTLAEVTNVPRSTSRGVEANARWALTPQIVLSGGVGLLDTEISKSDGQPGLANGNKLARSPWLSGQGAIEWKPTENWRASLRFGGRTGYYSDDANSPTRRVKGHWTLDARVEKAFGKARAYAYASNVLNNFGINYFLTEVVAELAPPRQVGIGVDMEF
ncbi:MAG: TonB-dependent receptor [Sphingomicrobium sp.]